jgi:hypothetical protein
MKGRIGAGVTFPAPPRIKLPLRNQQLIVLLTSNRVLTTASGQQMTRGV